LVHLDLILVVVCADLAQGFAGQHYTSDLVCEFFSCFRIRCQAAQLSCA
jgi:hypothetical protein